MDKIKIIAGVSFFEGLKPEQLADLAAIARDQNFKRGETIFSEGDEAGGLHVVSSGRVKIFKLAPDGKEQILHIFGTGEPFGEVAVFAGRLLPAYAEALEKTTTLFFPRPALIELIKKNPDMALSMLGVLSLRLRRFANLIEDLSLKEVPGRLAAYLLYLSRRQGDASELRLDITKGQLSSLLGTIPETLSRILAKMNRQGLIKTKGPFIELLDPDGLDELANASMRLSGRNDEDITDKG